VPYFAVAAVYGGEQNGSGQMYDFRIFNSEIIIPTAASRAFSSRAAAEKILPAMRTGFQGKQSYM
jgi:hypothetical protein